jgi:ADP-heptose:LPS heptosyltransferase
MNIRTMKALDQFVGVPLCLLLDLCQRMRAPFCRDRNVPVRRILLMKFFGMGSILLASPMLRAIKTRHPKASIGFLTFAGNREMVERLGLADVVYTLRTDSIAHFAADLFQVLGRVRRDRYDATIDMEFFSKFSTIVTYLSGSPVRIGFYLRQMWRGNLLTEQVYYNHYRHITEVFGALAAPLDVTVTDFSLQPPLTEADLRAAQALLAAEGVGKGALLIGFNVNTSDLSFERRWPQQEFVALAQGLLAELDVRLIFIGSPAEAGYVEETVAQLPRDGRVINLAGKTGLSELLGVLSMCRLLVTNDSGPLHLAAALDVATASFFGPETPTLYGPKGGDALVFYEGLYCSPCLNVFNVKTAPCRGNNVCIERIRAQGVLEKIRERFGDIWRRYQRAA